MQSFYQFHDPLYLLLVLVVPLLFWYQRRVMGKARLPYSDIAILKTDQTTFRQKFHFLPSLLAALSLMCVIVALARPQLTNRYSEIISEGIDIVLAIDASGSMKAVDFEINGEEANRLDAVKDVVSDFIGKRVSDRIGMVVFGDSAYTQAPLTQDSRALIAFLKQLRVGIAGEFTAIGNAIGTSLKRLKDQDSESKIIILLTDGVNNAGEVDPITAAAAAKDLGIKIYTIGVGSHGRVPYYEDSVIGKVKRYAKIELDEKTLQQIATMTEGRYFLASNTKNLAQIYDEIDTLEKTEIKTQIHHDFFELYPYALFTALILFLLAEILAHTYFLSLP